MRDKGTSRREFMRVAAAGAAALALPNAANAGEKVEKQPLIFFSKHLSKMNPAQMAEFVKEVKLDGFDLAVRTNQAVNPGNVATELPLAMKQWKEQELVVPMVSLDTGLIDPTTPSAKKIWAACAQAGINEIKVGYWQWRKGKSYWSAVDKAKKDLEGFAKLAEEHGPRALVHIHSGSNLTCNASTLMTLIRGFDPKLVGAYLDPAHLSINGEPVELALDIIGKHLAMVAVKSARLMPNVKSGTTYWRRKMCMLHLGFVDWRATLKLIKAAGYKGPFTIHAEYSDRMDEDKFKETVTKDVEFFKKALGR